MVSVHQRPVSPSNGPSCSQGCAYPDASRHSLGATKRPYKEENSYGLDATCSRPCSSMSSVNGTIVFTPSSSDITAFVALRYFAVSALACCIWDMIICMETEVAHIWNKSTTSWFIRISYVLLRYGIAGVIGFVIYVLNGMSPGHDHTQTCKSFLQLVLLLVMTSTVAANAYITYHHYLLWERRRSILVVLSVAFVCCYVPAAVLAFQSSFVYRDTALYVPQYNVCLYQHRPRTVQAFFAISLAFDFIAVFVAILNSFDRPYKRYGEVISSLLRDGGIWFLCVSAVRIINLVLFIVMPPAQSYIFSFNAWAMLSIMQSRFMMRVEALRRPHTSFRVWNANSEAFELGRWSSNAD